MEGFLYEDISTNEFGLKLISRDASTPSEKEIIENLPYVQGVYDFSSLLGERIFNNRDITYVFHLHEWKYGNRKIAEIKIKQWLMKFDNKPLYDTHDQGYYWMGKFSSISVEDSHISGMLIVTAIFNCYPFLISIKDEGNDLWDSFNFELDVAQKVTFDVYGTKVISLINIGSIGLTPSITTNAPMIIIKKRISYNVPNGVFKDDMFRLEIGENLMTIKGNGRISFNFYKELMA